MTDLPEDFEAQAINEARMHMAQLEATAKAHAASTGLVMAAGAPAAGATVAVTGQASFAMAFIYGKLDFDPGEISLSFHAEPLWGVGLSGGVSKVAGVIGTPSKGEKWHVHVTNSPGIVTGLKLTFLRGVTPMGVVVGPSLSGGIGMTSGGTGTWS